MAGALIHWRFRAEYQRDPVIVEVRLVMKIHTSLPVRIMFAYSAEFTYDRGTIV